MTMRQNKEQLLAKVDLLREQAAAKMSEIRPLRDQLASLTAEHDWLQAQIWDLSRQAAVIKVLPARGYSGPRKASKKPSQLSLNAIYGRMNQEQRQELLVQLQQMDNEL